MELCWGMVFPRMSVQLMSTHRKPDTPVVHRNHPTIEICVTHVIIGDSCYYRAKNFTLRICLNISKVHGEVTWGIGTSQFKKSRDVKALTSKTFIPPVSSNPLPCKGFYLPCQHFYLCLQCIHEKYVYHFPIVEHRRYWK